MSFKDYYHILGLDTNKCTINEIKNAYRSCAKRYHPDLNVGDVVAEEKIKDINEAYKVLSDQNSKKKYDRKWLSFVGFRQSIFAQNKKKTQVIKEMLFGEEQKDNKKANSRPYNSNEIETSIDINLKEAYNGCNKVLKLKENDKTYAIKIKSGILDKQLINVADELLVHVQVKGYKGYYVEKNKVWLDLKITPEEAVLGTKILIEDLDEDEDDFYIEVPKLSSSGDVITLESKGYKFKNNRDKLFVKLEIVNPKSMTKQVEDLYKKISELSNFNPR